VLGSETGQHTDHVPLRTLSPTAVPQVLFHLPFLCFSHYPIPLHSSFLLPSSFTLSAHPSMPPATVNATHFPLVPSLLPYPHPPSLPCDNSHRRLHPSRLTFSCLHATPSFPFAFTFALTLAPPCASMPLHHQCY
jgi:hypothetical protein